MVNFISRDYNPATSGYIAQPFGGTYATAVTSRFYVNFMYQLSVFLHKILGYSIVGETSWNINNTNVKSLLIATATNATPIVCTTATPHGLIDGYVVSITSGTGNTGVNGTWKVTVQSTTQFTLIGASGNGTYNANTATMNTGFIYSSGLVSDGYGAGINFGAGALFEVSIPVAKRTVVAADVGRMLVLKSNSFPTKNSGCFKISAINAGANRYVIDYRSTENPPAEVANSIDWWLYEKEADGTANAPSVSGYLNKSATSSLSITASTNATPIVVSVSVNNPHTWVTGQNVTISGHTVNTNANGNWTITQVSASSFSLNGSVGNGVGGATGTVSLTGYTGGTAATNSRIILQSPHSSGWQVRLAAEPNSSNLPLISVAVGYNGTSTGDFPQGKSTHVAQNLNLNLLDTTSTIYTNTVVGGGHTASTPVASRMSIVGDGYGQSVFVYTRTTGATNNGMLFFGIPDNEVGPPPNTDRVFCYGSAPTTDFGTIILKLGSATNVGMRMNTGNLEYCVLSNWANLDGTSATNPMLSANAGDSPFVSATELLPIEAWAGVATDIGLTLPQPTTPTVFSINQRFMGTTPGLRAGRTNFGNFTLSTEEVTTRAITAATNTSPIQLTTSVANALVTGQTVTVSGILGNTAANGTWTVTVINNQNFTLDNSVGNGTFVGATTIAVASNGQILPQSTINVASTTGFPTSGVIYVITSAGAQPVSYTGTTGTTFTGCTGGTGTMSTGGAVTTGFANGCTRFLHLQNGIYLQWNGASGLTP